MSKLYSGKIILLAALLFVPAVCLISCKDNMVSNVYFNITQNLRYEDNYELKDDNKVFKIRIKDFYNGENIAGAEAVLIFSNGYKVSKYSGSNGIIEVDKSLIPKEDFDICICYSKRNRQYSLKQRFFHSQNAGKVTILYLVSGNCELNYN